MKISEMTTDQATDAMIRISCPIKNICDDDDMVALLESFSKKKDIPYVKAVGQTIPELCLFALKKHKQDLYEIIGALGGLTISEVGKMNIKQTIKLVKDSYDDILKDFFTQSVDAEKKNES